MVCLGNICRSPMAHGIMKGIIKEKGLNWIVDSAGTGGWHVGQAPDSRAIEEARKNGVDISKQMAQQFARRHFDEYDHILVMDSQNMTDVCAQADSEAKREKVELFLGKGDVPDPYHDDALFAPVFLMIKERCLNLVEKWQG